MNKKKKTAIIYYLVAFVCYICSIVWFCSDDSGLGAMWLCIGSANLCLGSLWVNKSKAEEEKDEQKKDDDSDE